MSITNKLFLVYFCCIKTTKMNLFDFLKKFPDEQTCRTYLKDLRQKQGIICDSKDKVTGEICGCTKHYWLENVEKFQCSECSSRTNLKSGTMFFKSKISLQKWFMCIHLMTTTKKPFSCLELQRQLGFKRYEPVWDMMRKIRLSMGERDSQYQLEGEMEIDEGFFEIVNLPKKDRLGNVIEEKKELKRGRGSENKSKVLVICESKPREQTKKHQKNRELGYVKMIVMDDLTSVGINYEVGKSVEEGSHIISDNFRGYSRLLDVVSKHTPMTVPPKESMTKLPWVHTVISNCKRELLGTHHSIGKEYLQTYLNEFCYKLNRRNFETDLFDRMLLCGIQK